MFVMKYFVKMFLKELLKIYLKVVLYIDFRYFAYWITKEKYCENFKMIQDFFQFFVKNSTM